MLISNAMRFGTDIFGSQTTTPGGGSTPEVTLVKSARLEAKQPLDATNLTHIDGFQIEGTAPAGTDRRFLFKVDDTIYKFFNGSPRAYSGDGSLANILAYGNTSDDLAAVTDLSSWLGKEIYPIIALTAPYDSDFPTVKLSLKTHTTTDALSKSLYSAVTKLEGDNPKIADVNADFVTEGQATCTVNIRLYQNGAWTSWLPLNEAQNQSVTFFQIRIVLKVVDIGEDSAQINAVTIRYTTGEAPVSGDVAELFTPYLDFEVPLQTAYLVVKHKRLIDSTIDADVSFLPAPAHRERYQLGISSGSKESFSLPDTQIDHSTLQVFVDGELTNDFDFNLEVNEVTLNAPRDSAVAVSYDYNCGAEVWLPMSRSSDQQPNSDDDFYSSRFALSTTLDNYSKAAVRIKFTRTSGTQPSTVLGVATGKVQQYALPHRMTKLYVTGGVDYSYDQDSNILTLVATAGKTVKFSGNWQGEQHAATGFVAGFAL